MKYTTAYPFRLPGSGDVMVCVYCMKEIPTCEDYRRHMREEHRKFKPQYAFLHVNWQEYGKVDITDMRCRLCATKFENLETVAKHLVEEHDIDIDLTSGVPLQPYRLEHSQIICGICDASFLGFRQTGKHMSTHFQKVTCDVCGKSYKSNTSLYRHTKLVHQGKMFPCYKCLKGFNSSEERRAHVLSTKRCWSYCCAMCGERFISWPLKQEHLVQVHNQRKKTYPCGECNEVFTDAQNHRIHYTTKHTDNNYKCSFCSVAFESDKRLEDHIVIHTKEKRFPCPVCTKLFPRKKSLSQHMWIHREQKRFECIPCNKKFNQKVSWRGHMKSHHPEQDME